MRPQLALVALLVAFAAPLAASAQDEPTVRVHRLEGMVHGVSAAVLERVLIQAEESGDALVVLEMDTPGGLVVSAEDMISAILNSPVPVAAFVTPRGAHAASAGFFLLLAADVAAMSPVTRTGSAHPVTAGGQNTKEDIGLKKVAEDLAALIRSAAAARGRPADLAEQAVTEAKAWSAEEALEVGLIDLLVTDTEELVGRLDGREIIRSDGARQTLDLAGAKIIEHELTDLEEIKSVVLHPLVMGLLLVLAGIGFYIEFQNPGMFVPGLLGLACLLVFLYGTQVLPVNIFGLALVALGIVMFVLELKVPSFGLLTLGGGACVAAGLYLLFDSGVPGMEIPVGSILFLTAVMMIVVTGVGFLVVRAQRRSPTTGREGVVGEVGEAATALDPDGTVMVHGEFWAARADAPLPRGARVRVVAVLPGLKLSVEAEDPVVSGESYTA